MYSNWGYELGVDFAAGDADVKDAYIEYLGEFDSSAENRPVQGALQPGRADQFQIHHFYGARPAQ